ncbi:hypothetical protein LINPERPRIM_LOCUS30205, partial [Linum perenne]
HYSHNLSLLSLLSFLSTFFFLHSSLTQTQNIDKKIPLLYLMIPPMPSLFQLQSLPCRRQQPSPCRHRQPPPTASLLPLRRFTASLSHERHREPTRHH